MTKPLQDPFRQEGALERFDSVNTYQLLNKKSSPVNIKWFYSLKQYRFTPKLLFPCYICKCYFILSTIFYQFIFVVMLMAYSLVCRFCCTITFLFKLNINCTIKLLSNNDTLYLSQCFPITKRL
jgi:hypothetical protein